MQPNPHATLDKVPELLTLQFPVDISSAGVLYFRRGLRCKQAGLFVLLATPVTALLGWQVKHTTTHTAANSTANITANC